MSQWIYFIIFWSIGFISENTYAETCNPSIQKSFILGEKIEKLSSELEKINLEVDRCSYSISNRKPKHLIYLFEGRNGFSKDLLIAFKKFQSQNPKCIKGSDGQYIFKFPDGKWMYAENLKGQFDDIVHPKTTGTAVGLKNFIIEGFCQSQLDFSETEVVLWGQEEGVDEAVACMKKQYWNRFDDIHTPNVLVLGYSRGGARAIEFANRMLKEGITVNQGLTIDPVPTKLSQTLTKIPAAYLGIPLKSHTPDSFKIPNGVKWENYWQEKDNRWNIVGGMNSNSGLHGSPVDGAQTNKLIEVTKANGETNGGHWRIFFEDEVKTIIKKNLEEIRHKQE